MGAGDHWYDYPGWVHAHAIEEGEGELPGPSASDPIAAAREFLGCAYEWGGLTAAGIDCSGLVHIAYRATGRLVPRDSWQQEAAGEPVAPGEERPGDLIAYGSTERADHVAFWLGGGRILHATLREPRRGRRTRERRAGRSSSWCLPALTGGFDPNEG